MSNQQNRPSPNVRTGAEVRVFDANGKLMLRQRNTTSGALVGVSGLPAGVYAVQIADLAETGRIYPVRQLVKM